MCSSSPIRMVVITRTWSLAVRTTATRHCIERWEVGRGRREGVGGRERKRGREREEGRKKGRRKEETRKQVKKLWRI